MLRVILEIDNVMAHSCSPVEYLQKYILRDATEVVDMESKVTILDCPYARIKVNHIEQI